VVGREEIRASVAAFITHSVIVYHTMCVPLRVTAGLCALMDAQ
jgi:hypothetical protein